MGMYIGGYNIDEYLNRCCTMDLVDVIRSTQEDLVRLSSMNLPKNNEQKSRIIAYRNFLNDFTDFLSGAPIGIISERDRPKIKPVIQHFVEQKQMNENVLKLFE